MANTSVLISGIGIAGPTLAYWLLRAGFSPTLVERAPRLRRGGYVIDFWGLGYDIAERMRLVPELKSEGYDIQELRLVNAQGRRIAGFGVDVFRKLTQGRYVSIARSELASLVYRKIEGRCETIFGDSIAGITQSGEGATVTFEHNDPRTFDLVIGADGLHSRVREVAFGPQRRFETYLGYKVAAFEVDGYRPRDELVYVSYSLPGRQAARFALRGDRTLILMIFASDRPLGPDLRGARSQKACLHDVFGKAGWECPQMLAALDRCDDLYFDDVSQIRMTAWTSGRTALLGDAGFCPSLFAGQGSALAMVAAYVLAGELARHPDRPLVALERYEKLLRPLMSAKQKATERFSRSFAPKTRMGLYLRNQMTKAFALPLVARFALGRSLLDRLELPEYFWTED
jgi:2-polyprenyl-6-methoxyphenol hydroxylase-like FAD-dependent oxidoreductase